MKRLLHAIAIAILTAAFAQAQASAGGTGGVSANSTFCDGEGNMMTMDTNWKPLGNQMHIRFNDATGKSAWVTALNKPRDPSIITASEKATTVGPGGARGGTYRVDPKSHRAQKKDGKEWENMKEKKEQPPAPPEESRSALGSAGVSTTPIKQTTGSESRSPRLKKLLGPPPLWWLKPNRWQNTAVQRGEETIGTAPLLPKLPVF